MDFIISETEYNKISSVRGQLNLIYGLLCSRDANLNNFDAADLQDFVSAQVDTISGVVKAIDARYELQRKEEHMQPFLWLYALRIAKGDVLNIPNGAEIRVTNALRQAVKIDEDMKPVLDAWIDVLVKEPVVNTPIAPAKKPAPRKRDKLAEKSLEAV